MMMNDDDDDDYLFNYEKLHNNYVGRYLMHHYGHWNCLVFIVFHSMLVRSQLGQWSEILSPQTNM